MLAAKNGHGEVVKLLIEAGVDLHLQNDVRINAMLILNQF